MIGIILIIMIVAIIIRYHTGRKECRERLEVINTNLEIF